MAGWKVARVTPKRSDGERLEREGAHTSPQFLSQCSPYTDGETEAQRDSERGPKLRNRSKEKPGLILA